MRALSVTVKSTRSSCTMRISCSSFTVISALATSCTTRSAPGNCCSRDNRKVFSQVLRPYWNASPAVHSKRQHGRSSTGQAPWQYVMHKLACAVHPLQPAKAPHHSCSYALHHQAAAGVGTCREVTIRLSSPAASCYSQPIVEHAVKWQTLQHIHCEIVSPAVAVQVAHDGICTLEILHMHIRCTNPTAVSRLTPAASPLLTSSQAVRPSTTHQPARRCPVTLLDDVESMTQ